jgi:hypothetical protein
MPDASLIGAPQRLTAALYLAAAVVLLTAVADAVSNAWPFALGTAQWRYGAIGLASNFLLTALLGVIIAVGTAAWRGHAVVLRLGGPVLVVVALLLVAAALAFTLDAVTLYRQVPDDDMRQFRIGAIKAVGKYLTTAAVLAVTGLGAWRSAPGERRRQDAKLVMGAG